VSVRRAGFTLVEALLVLALAGPLVIGSSAALHRLGPKLDLQAAIWEVTAGLNQARFRAIMSGAPVRVRFAAPGCILESYDAASDAWREARAIALPGVGVRANNSPVFHPQGTVSDLATITVENARGAYRITIAITGRIRAVRVG
jgi:hypothetical protein